MRITAALLALALVGCGSESPNTPPPPPPPPAPLAWTPCPLHFDGKGPAAECSTTKLPLRAKDPSGKTIDVFVKRYHPAGGKSLRALWMLQGGPGGSGAVFENIAEQMATKYPDVDYYLPDHRGTGASTKLTCAGTEPTSQGSTTVVASEWAACLDEVKATWGSDLAAFNTTEAANDLGALIERTKVPNQTVFVLGISYGTYWAHRFLQIFPKLADGVVLDSIAPPGMTLARQDEDANVAVQDFFAVCDADATCASHMGPESGKRAQALVAKLDGGHCPALKPPPGMDVKTAVRRLNGSLLMNPQLRGFIPPIVLRVDRCSPDDVAAMNHLFEIGFVEKDPTKDPLLAGWGWVVGHNIALSELWESPEPTPAQLAAIRDGAIASRDVTTLFDPVLATWPRYTPDAYAGKWATTDTPMLMLVGGLDPATIPRRARAMKPHFTGPAQYWIEVPTASHTVIASSTTKQNRSCGTMMMMSFLENPKSTPDTSCLADVRPLSFEGDPQLAIALFGTALTWD